ncbi:MAG: hypothetical protein IT318_22925, partial [Anaerolineales bacterium]|nr:hypothetical protein [Anaerolineales bacterium]
AARHRSLEAAIDWSYRLLSAAEQRLFSRLSIFQGGWTLPAAEQVCAGDGVEAGAVVGLLGSLVDKSMVVAETAATGGTRYRLLETLREFGRERLAEGGEAEGVGDRHTDYFVRLAEDAGAGMDTPDEPAWVARLGPEEDNLFAAMQRSLARDAGAAALRIGGALTSYLADVARRRSEWSDLMARALDQHPEVSPAQQGRVLCQMAKDFVMSNKYDRARVTADEAVRLARASGDRAQIGRALAAQGFCLDGDAQRASYEAAVQLARETGDIESAKSMCWLANIESPEAARALLLEYRDMGLKRGSLGVQALVAHSLGLLATSLGDPAEAVRQWEAELRLVKGIGWQFNRILTLQNLASASWSLGAYPRAAALLDEGLDITLRSGWLLNLALAFRMQGTLAWRQGDYAEAEASFRESNASASRWNSPVTLAVTDVWRTRLARDTGDLAQARAQGEQALATLKEGGKAGTFQVALSQAGLASVAHRQDDLAGAVALYQDALRAMRHDRGLMELRDVLEGLGLALGAAGDTALSLRLLGLAAGKLAAFGIVRPVPEQGFYDQELKRLKAEADPDAFAQAWEAGQALTFEEAIAEALGEVQ